MKTRCETKSNPRAPFIAGITYFEITTEISLPHRQMLRHDGR
jgi:hypothetical protein